MIGTVQGRLTSAPKNRLQYFQKIEIKIFKGAKN